MGVSFISSQSSPHFNLKIANILKLPSALLSQMNQEVNIELSDLNRGTIILQDTKLLEKKESLNLSN